jgi:hypothetical protein
MRHVRRKEAGVAGTELFTLAADFRDRPSLDEVADLVDVLSEISSSTNVNLIYTDTYNILSKARA